MTVPAWSGRRVTEARGYMATLLPASCWLCHRTITADQDWVIEHKQSRATHPELTWVLGNWAHSHRACSDRTGMQAVIAKARQEGARGEMFSSTASHGGNSNT